MRRLLRVTCMVLALLVVGCTGAGTADEEARVQRTTLSYGASADQVVDLAWPTEGDAPFPVLVLVHGGFWRQAYGKDLMVPLARDAVMRGFASANVEYRRVGGEGGWPATFEDVAAAMDALAEADAPLDLDRVVVVGHSAGGHLAAWAASRPRIPGGEVGADPVVVPCAAVSQAGVVSLARSAREGVGGDATTALMGGGPDEVPARYDVGDPTALAPPPVPVLLVHGSGDDTVPVTQAEAYAEAAGDRAELQRVDGDHFSVIDPGDESWGLTMDWVTRHC